MLHAGLEENSSSPANLSHCHPGSTCTLRCLIHLAWGLLKQLGLRLLYCSFFVKFPCWLSYKWEYLFRRWLEKSKWWTMQPGRCRVRVRTPPARERTRGVVHASYGNGKNDLGVSDDSLQKKKKRISFIAFTMSLYLSTRKRKYTLCRACRHVSNTCDHLTSTPFLPAVCSTKFTQVHPMFCSLRVPSCWASRREGVRLQFCIARLMISKQRKR